MASVLRAIHCLVTPAVIRTNAATRYAMVFSSPFFLFLFLPIVLTIYPLLPGIAFRNLFLLAVSLLFYGWGEPGFLLLLLGSTLAN